MTQATMRSDQITSEVESWDGVQSALAGDPNRSVGARGSSLISDRAAGCLRVKSSNDPVRLVFREDELEPTLGLVE
jgi:hypothetical protein